MTTGQGACAVLPRRRGALSWTHGKRRDDAHGEAQEQGLGGTPCAASSTAGLGATSADAPHIVLVVVPDSDPWTRPCSQRRPRDFAQHFLGYIPVVLVAVEADPPPPSGRA